MKFADIDLSKIPYIDSPQKKALLQAIKKVGKMTYLARLMGKPRSQISMWLHADLSSKPDLSFKRPLASERPLDLKRDLMTMANALLMESVTGIKGVAKRLCPSLKKFKKIG